MTDTTTTEVPEEPQTEPTDEQTEAPEGDISDATPDEPDAFPRSYVEDLRQENGRYRQRAQQADTLAQRLHTELVRATGKLADPTDLPFDEAHIDDPEALAAAVDDLLAKKPHLASRKPSGDIGQGQRGATSEPFSLLGLLKQRT
ncbi:hypothetical protein [Mycobacterium sp. M26]|uniref:hypothetical protein n=1 Tax=Mycobacterium sp. M26 TaxID=1762962 RepID=UPI00073F3002|nr:hypothetical protein [Mycobacterium sp. M26]